MSNLYVYAAIAALPLLAGCATSSASAQALSQAEAPADVAVPMSFASGRPAVQAEVAGQVLTIAFDTGGQSAIIPRSLATELGLTVVGETLVGSPYGGEPIHAEIVALGNLSVGGVEARDATAVVLDDNRFPANERRLIIGSSQFADRVIILDFARSTMTLATSAPAEPGSWQPLDERNFMRTDLNIGANAIPVIIDSGNPRGLVLPLDQLERIAPGRARIQVGEVRTVNGAVPRYAADIGLEGSVSGITLQLGRTEFAPVPVGNMGSTALAGMQLIIDMPRRQWRLRAVAPQPISVSTPPQ